MIVAAINSHADITISEPVDTVMVIDNAPTVLLTESATGTTLKIFNENNDTIATYTMDNPVDGSVTLKQSFAPPVFAFGCQPSYKHSINIEMIGGIHFGFSGTLGAPAGLDIEMGKSYEIGIDNLLTCSFSVNRNNRNYLSLGMGVNWRNYRMTGNTRFIVDDAGNVTYGGYADDVLSRYSNVKVFSLGFPIMFSHKTNIKTLGPSTLRFKFGAILNWNSHASAVSAWTEADGTNARQSTSNLRQRKFTVDLMAAIGFAPTTGLYIKYSPMKLFPTDHGPDFTTISTGIYFGF